MKGKLKEPFAAPCVVPAKYPSSPAAPRSSPHRAVPRTAHCVNRRRFKLMLTNIRYSSISYLFYLQISCRAPPHRFDLSRVSIWWSFSEPGFGITGDYFTRSADTIAFIFGAACLLTWQWQARIWYAKTSIPVQATAQCTVFGLENWGYRAQATVRRSQRIF